MNTVMSTNRVLTDGVNFFIKTCHTYQKLPLHF